MYEKVWGNNPFLKNIRFIYKKTLLLVNKKNISKERVISSYVEVRVLHFYIFIKNKNDWISFQGFCRIY